MFHFFGKSIASSASDFVFEDISFDIFKDLTKTEEMNIIDKQGYEDDFTMFVDGKEDVLVSTEVSISDNSGAVAVNLSALSGKYKIYDGTSVINNTKYDVTSLLYDNYTHPKLNKDDPYILIYHTHTSESYHGGGSVVDVGESMAEEFEKLGYKTIHLTEVYDKGQFSGSYSRSIKGVEQMLEKYPTIQLAFDVHRDSITTTDGDTYRPLTVIDGQNCAQVMFVCGTDAKGLEHPNWRQNFKFALDISRNMGKSYGALSRPVNLRGDRFNTHVTNFAFLMEVGSDANTLNEAKLGAIYTARAVINTIEN